MGPGTAEAQDLSPDRTYLRDRFRSAFKSEETLSKISSSGSNADEKPLAAGGSDPFAATPAVTGARNGLLENKLLHAIVIWAVAAAFLWLLKPPLVCRTRSDDDLDGFRCSWGRIAVWSSLAPASYYLLPKFTT